jgi:lipid A 3-O-deacylase
MTTCRLAAVLASILPLSSLWTSMAHADDTRCVDRGSPVVNMRSDNDLFGSGDQDQGYSNGLVFSLVSPNLSDFTRDPCLPRPARWLNRHLRKLHDRPFEQQNMVFTFGHALFTPVDYRRTDLIEDDRPYVGGFLLGFGYNARSGDEMRTSLLRLGMVGPSARGEQVQNGWHSLIGSDHFEGWDNQIGDELVAQYTHERLRRHDLSPNSGRWGHDLITHWGGAVGNLGSHANAGFEWRFGYRLPNDFGSTPLRPSGENTAPSLTKGYQPGLRWHLFVTADGRAVLNDITLDGNTFKDSHSVDARHFVADLGYGMVFAYGRWKFAFARYYRTWEFEGQRERPEFGSFTISVAL